MLNVKYNIESLKKTSNPNVIYTLTEEAEAIANAANLKAIPDNKADYVDLFSNSDNLKNKIRKLVKMKNFFPACDFCDGRPHAPEKALEYAGKGLIKAGKQIPISSSLSFKEY